MQKFWNVGSVIIILGLGIWIFFLLRANIQWKEFIQNLSKKIIPADQLKTAIENDVSAQSISGGELWNQFQSKVNEMTIDLKFNNK